MASFYRTARERVVLSACSSVLCEHNCFSVLLQANPHGISRAGQSTIQTYPQGTVLDSCSAIFSHRRNHGHLDDAAADSQTAHRCCGNVVPLNSILEWRNTYQFTGILEWFSGYEYMQCDRLQTPSFFISPEDTTFLSFRTSYNVCAEYDGGVVQIKTEQSDDWININPENAWYPYWTSPDSISCIGASVPCFSAFNKAWEKFTFNLYYYAGQNITLSYLFGADNQESEDVVTQIKHNFEDVTTTQVHNHLRNKCLEIFVLDGDSKRIKEMVRQYQISRKMDYVKLIVA